MPRKKDLHPSERVRIDGNRKRGGISEREQKTWAWLDGLPPGERFDRVWELITAAVNGELGVALHVEGRDEDAEQSQAALEQLLANMVMDEED